MVFKHRLALVIATKDRPDSVRSLLMGLQRQTYLPKQIVVVDGSDHPILDTISLFSDLPIQYVKVRPPALTKQKNAGVSALADEIDLVGFIDDDIQFEPDSLEKMMEFWETASAKLGGASFNLTNFNYQHSRFASISKSIFFINDTEFGKVHRSGFNTPIWDTHETKSCRWLGGGYTVWRREVFDRWQFDEWFAGSGLWEDVHFSHQVARHYVLAVVAEARANHLEGDLSYLKQIRLGMTQIVNWVYFVKCNNDLSLLMCLWACTGRTGFNLCKGTVKLDAGLILRGIGNIAGITASVLRLVNPLKSMSGR